jgi:hypothetical protein
MTKNIFEIQNEFKEKQKKKSYTAYEAYNKLAEHLGYYKYDSSVELSKEILYTIVQDKNGGKHIIFIKKFLQQDPVKYKIWKDKLEVFYNNFYGTGEMCRDTSEIICTKHPELEFCVEGLGDATVDFLTVLTVIMCNQHCNSVFLMRLLCDWLYNKVSF